MLPGSAILKIAALVLVVILNYRHNFFKWEIAELG